MGSKQVVCSWCGCAERVGYQPDHLWCCSLECYNALWAEREAPLFRDRLRPALRLRPDHERRTAPRQ